MNEGMDGRGGAKGRWKVRSVVVLIPFTYLIKVRTQLNLLNASISCGLTSPREEEGHFSLKKKKDFKKVR